MLIRLRNFFTVFLLHLHVFLCFEGPECRLFRFNKGLRVKEGKGLGLSAIHQYCTGLSTSPPAFEKPTVLKAFSFSSIE